MQFYYVDCPAGIATLKRACRDTKYSMQGYIEQSLNLFINSNGKWAQDSSFEDKSEKLPVKMKNIVSSEWALLLSELNANGYPKIGTILIRYMIMYTIINQADFDFFGTAKNTEQEMGKVFEATKFTRVGVKTSIADNIKKLCSQNKISVNLFINYLMYVLTKNKALIFQKLSAKQDDESLASLMLYFCNTVFGLQSEKSLEDFYDLNIGCALDAEKLNQLFELSAQAKMSRRKMLRCVVHYAIRHHKVRPLTEKMTEKRTERILQQEPKSDKIIHLSIRLPHDLRENFKRYCVKKNITAASLLRIFVKNFANKDFLATVLRSCEDAKLDTNVSLYIHTSDLDIIKSVAEVIETSYAMIIRSFMYYCLTDNFDWTKLENGNGI